MAGRKHLILVHGRSTKPSEDEKKRIALQALRHGLARRDKQAADRLSDDPNDGQVKFSLAYYGDLSNSLILKKYPHKKDRLKGTDPRHKHLPCEKDGFYDEGLKQLYRRKTGNHGEQDYKAFLARRRDNAWWDNAASVVSALGNLVGVSDTVIATPLTADLAAYLKTRQYGSGMRDRLQKILKPALLEGDDVCLMAHSMGCMVSYDVLWKYSRMSEYRDIQRKKATVQRWITLGNPLGEPGVRQNLYDADEDKDGMYPKKIVKKWINFSAKDDFICHDTTVADDFREMTRRRYVESIEDRKMYNFWMGAKATNPHKLYGYLDNPDVASEVIDWMNA